MAPTKPTISLCIRTTVRQSARSIRSSTHPVTDEYFDDLAIAYRAEIKELYALGCRASRRSTVANDISYLFQKLQVTYKSMTLHFATFATKQ